MSPVNLAGSSTSTAYATGAATLAEPVADTVQEVSWRAVWAGAVAAASLSLILFVLGTGLGLASVSPWSFRGASAATIATTAIVWVIVTQLAASAIGGYIAGRMRGRWSRVRDDEVYFRDTAHGLLAWGLSTLFMAGLTAMTVGTLAEQGAKGVGAAANAVASTAQAATGGDAAMDGGAYWVDAMLRADPIAAAATPGVVPVVVDPGTDATMRAQASRILLRAFQTGTLPPEDSRYLAQLVAQRTGLTTADAQRRVNDTYARARQSLNDAEMQIRQKADEARKASAYTSMWLFVSLLAGAFVAAWMATFGGRQRDAAQLLP